MQLLNLKPQFVDLFIHSFDDNNKFEHFNESDRNSTLNFLLYSA